jgi:hypothetical protein
MTTILYIALAIIGSYLGGFVTRWIADYRMKRKEKEAIEAKYRLKLKEETERIKQTYENQINALSDMSNAERLDWLANRTK